MRVSRGCIFIERFPKLRKKNFVLVTDFMMHFKMGKKIYLRENETESLVRDLDAFFDRMVDVERIKVGKRQTTETLIAEGGRIIRQIFEN